MTIDGQRKILTQRHASAFLQDAAGYNCLIVSDANLVRAIEKCRKLFDLSGEQVLTCPPRDISRDKTRVVKQGMMQQLLTGRVRLIKPKQM